MVTLYRKDGTKITLKPCSILDSPNNTLTLNRKVVEWRKKHPSYVDVNLDIIAYGKVFMFDFKNGTKRELCDLWTP